MTPEEQNLVAKEVLKFLPISSHEKRMYYDPKLNQVQVGNKCFRYNIDSSKQVHLGELFKRNNELFCVLPIAKKTRQKRTVKSRSGKINKKYLFLLTASISTFSLLGIGTSLSIKASAAEDSQIVLEETISPFPEEEIANITLNLPMEEPVLEDKKEENFQLPQEETSPVVSEPQKFYEVPCPAEYQEYIYNLCLNYHVPFRVAMTIGHIESGGEWNNNGKISKTNDYGSFQINQSNFPELRQAFGYGSTSSEINRFQNDILYNPEFNAQCAIYLMGNWFKSIDPTDYEDMLGRYNGWVNWRKKSISRNYVKKGLQLMESIYVPLEIDESVSSALKI